jgi:hypothetical protein
VRLAAHGDRIRDQCTLRALQPQRPGHDAEGERAVSGACVAPGPKSLQGLAWLARAGASPLEPLQLVLGCSRRRTLDHVRRLSDAQLVRRVTMTRGDGSLLLVTAAGARVAGLPAASAPRGVAPTTWAHASGCAWVSAWLQLRGRSWVSEREVLDDEFWRCELRYQDRRGTVRITHRPDLGVRTAAGPVAIEVELQRKSAARLRAICALYAQLTEHDAPLGGVIYVCGRADVAERVAVAAELVGLRAPALSVRSLRDVVAQTRAAAGVENLVEGGAG